MSEFFDDLETRDPQARERDLFARLPAAIAHAMTAPGWARQLAGIDPTTVTSRAAPPAASCWRTVPMCWAAR